MARYHAPRTPVRVGLIGCGRIAQAVHLRLLTRLPGVRLVALAETDPVRLAAAAAQAPRAARFTNYADLLARPEVEAVVVCVPNTLHAAVALAALDAGKHVYLEKPLATDLDDAGRLCQAWRRSGRIGMIGFNYRCNRLYQAARSLIRSGRIGPVVAVRSVFATARHQLPDWKRARQNGGGVLLDLASHDLDLLRFLFDQEIAEVFADVRSLHSEGDSATLQLRLVGGIPVQSVVSLCAVEEARCEVYGQAGKIEVDRYQGLTARVRGPWVGGWRRRLWNSLPPLGVLPYLLQKYWAPANEPSFARALAHFAQAVRGHHPASPDFHDGYRSLAVVAAAEESARTGRVVAPLDVEREPGVRCGDLCLPSPLGDC